MLKDNIIFTDHKTGSRGKGLITVKHGITHFIDDSLPVLQSIYDHTLASTEKEPKALFHFPRSGRLHKEIWADEKQNAQPACFKQVHNWTDVLDSMDLAGLETKAHIPEQNRNRTDVSAILKPVHQLQPEESETDSPHMIDPQNPSIQKTSDHSIEVETNIVDAMLSPNRRAIHY